jgi:hypothetical protein
VDPRLETLLASQQIPQSLLLTGTSIAYLEEQALLFAKRLLNISALPHVDVTVYSPQGKTAQYGIDALRAFKEDVYRSPYEASRKAFILLEAERMAPVGANALLKVFEEPLLTSYILLCSTSPDQILPTVRSRCQKVELVSERAATSLPEGYFELLGSLDIISPLQLLEESDRIAAWIADKAAEASPVEETQQELSPHQKEALEKQQEAVNALKATQLLRNLSLRYLSWVRDLHLLNAGCLEPLLSPSEHLPKLQQQLARGFLPPINGVEEQIDRALLECSRFQPMPALLFRLFDQKEMLQRQWI